MTEISKEELNAHTEAQVKTANALSKITDRLQDLTTKQDKILERLNNGFVKTVADIDTKAEEVRKDIKWMKTVFSMLFGLIGLSILILEIIKRFFE